MTVTVDGHVRYRWHVSTGATKYSTPAGSYNPFRMERMHYSREWDNAGMPHSIFFSSRGHAIHGSDHPRLGTPASHGCVRLSLGNAATLFALVSARGVSNTKVVVRGPDPPGYHAATQIPQRRQPARPVGLFGDFSVNAKPLLGGASGSSPADARFCRGCLRPACSCQDSPAALSECAARGRGGDLAILLILSRRRNATKVSTLTGTF